MTVKGIWGAEPQREGEYPWCYIVGSNGVTSIIEFNQAFGDYGILWFQVWSGPNQIAKLNAKHIAVVTYEETP